MAGLSAFDGARIRRRQPRPWPWFLAGLVLGAAIGWGAPKVLDRAEEAAPVEPAATPRAKAVPTQALRIVARPGRGMTLAAAGPLKLQGPGEGELAEQKGQTIFVGLRNWDGTVNYLVGGQGKLFLRDADNVAIGGTWSENEYRRFARGQRPLQVKVRSGTTYTVYFQRSGSTEIDLGKFRVAAAPPRRPGAKPVATVTFE